MPTVTWDHVHLRTPDPEAMAAWLADILGGEIIRGPGRIDVKLGGANVFLAPVAPATKIFTWSPHCGESRLRCGRLHVRAQVRRGGRRHYPPSPRRDPRTQRRKGSTDGSITFHIAKRRYRL